MPQDLLSQVVDLGGMKTGSAAMKACGMQPELATHLMLQSKALGINIILRAGSPPVYNVRRGPKTGFNLSKTSNQGLFKGSLAKDKIFTRIDSTTGLGLGHHDKDHKHLQLAVTDPDHQYTVPLSITMQDILREIGSGGDLKVLSCDDETLRLAYKEGKGDKNFKGQFVIKLRDGKDVPMFYSRPWDKPDTNSNNKPVELSSISDDDYQNLFHRLFTVEFGVTQDPSEKTKSAEVFANTPRTTVDLKRAILDSKVVGEDDDILQCSNRKEILEKLGPDTIKQVYDHCALITTGDWDGLALGHPPDLNEVFSKVYNTFDVVNGLSEQTALCTASIDYFNELKHDSRIQGTELGQLIASIENPKVLFSDFSLERAGCITPHEFLYEQLINYSYRDKINSAYGNNRSNDAIQKAMNKALEYVHSNQFVNHDEPFKTCFDIAQSAYENQVKERRKSMVNPDWAAANNASWKSIDLEHLGKHLKKALEHPTKPYIVPDVNHDHNVHDLFQHGFDMRNPYGSNLEGAWLLITNEGSVVYGDTQEQLCDVLLIEGFLEHNVFPVNHGADMNAGWGEVVMKQLELGQPVSEKTLEQYDLWKSKKFKSRFQDLLPTEEESPKLRPTS